MITTENIREKIFEKTTFGGYAMGEVDDFLDEIANDIAVREKENATLRAKMKVLVAKIEQYRGSEDAMNRALVTAQRLADSIEGESREKADALIAEAQATADALVAEAQANADTLVAEAQSEYDRVMGDVITHRREEELRYRQAAETSGEYIRKMRLLTEQQSAFLAQLQDADLSGAIVTPPPAEKKAIAAPEEPVEELETVEEEAEPVEETVAEPTEDEEYEDEPEASAEPAPEAPAEAEPVDFAKIFENAVFNGSIPEEDADEDETPLF